MKKFFTIVVILIAVFMFRTQIEDITGDLVNYIQSSILNKNDSDKPNSISIKTENDVNNVEEGNDSYNGVSSYDNYKNIRLGESLYNVISKMGEPNKTEYSEYGFKWYVYNQDNSKFCMVGILDNKVVGLFSNTMNSVESNNIKLGDTESEVLKKYTPLKYRLIKNVRYILNEDYYSLIESDYSYITAFYDSLDGNKVVGIQIITKDIEKSMSGIYSTDNSITNDFENVNRYLINVERSKRGLNTLSYDESETLCARAHSKDMRDNDFFAHDNLKNQTPFDRMLNYGINYRGAAENIAAGQTSAIFAHYALMNSEGHRVNILGDYDYVGVGVVFGGSSNMYLTQDFYR